MNSLQLKNKNIQIKYFKLQVIDDQINSPRNSPRRRL
jgi:hypothetical protein